MVILVALTSVAADTQLATSVAASSGGRGSSTHFAVKSTVGQPTPIGPAASTNFEVGAGFWYQDPVAPSAIGDLTAKLSVNDIVLQWAHAADNVAIDQYIVYRGTNPGFVPGSGNVLGQTKGSSYLDPGAAGTVGTDYFYVVRATDPAGNLAVDSNRVGEFDRGVINHPK
jgi:hypothetical protein